MTTNELPREPTELDRLVAAARDGDRPAFDELVRRTYVDTYTLAMRLTADEEDARDVVQETYLRAWKGLGGFRGDAQFTTWLYRITANTAYSTVKRRRRHRAESLDALVEEPVEARIEAQPEESAEQSAALARLAGALEHLPPKLRVLVVLKDVYGLSHEEIAEELGISVAAAKVRLHRGASACATSSTTRCSRRGEARACGVTRSPGSCPRRSRAARPSSCRCSATSSRACAARPSWPATGRCCGVSSCCGPATWSPRPACSPRPWPRSRRPASARPVGAILNGRRLAYAGAIGSAAVAAGTAATVMIVHRSRRRAAPRQLTRPADRRQLVACGRSRDSLLSLSTPARPRPEGSSSIGRAPVSKTGGWGFESLLPCSE